MKYYARLENNVVVEIIKTDNDITKLYHPDFVAELIECDSTVNQGFVWENGKFHEPVIAKPDLIAMQYDAIDAYILETIKTANVIGEPADYDSLGELALYANSNNDSYLIEARALIDFVDRCHKIQADIKNRAVTYSSIDEAIAALPSLNVLI